jgi:hypothetical protein
MAELGLTSDIAAQSRPKVKQLLQSGAASGETQRKAARLLGAAGLLGRNVIAVKRGRKRAAGSGFRT